MSIRNTLKRRDPTDDAQAALPVLLVGSSFPNPRMSGKCWEKCPFSSTLAKAVKCLFTSLQRLLNMDQLYPRDRLQKTVGKASSVAFPTVAENRGPKYLPGQPEHRHPPSLHQWGQWQALPETDQGPGATWTVWPQEGAVTGQGRRPSRGL